MEKELLVSLDASWKVVSAEMKTAIENGLINGKGAVERMLKLTDALREVDITIANTVRTGLQRFEEEEKKKGGK